MSGSNMCLIPLPIYWSPTTAPVIKHITENIRTTSFVVEPWPLMHCKLCLVLQANEATMNWAQIHSDLTHHEPCSRTVEFVLYACPLFRAQWRVLCLSTEMMLSPLPFRPTLCTPHPLPMSFGCDLVWSVHTVALLGSIDYEHVSVSSASQQIKDESSMLQRTCTFLL